MLATQLTNEEYRQADQQPLKQTNDTKLQHSDSTLLPVN